MAIESQTVLVKRFQYVHVQDNNTGDITLHEGPARLQLESHQEIIRGVQEKIRVADGQFAIVLNPYSAEAGDIVEGEREIRVGPTVFALHPGERLEAAKDKSPVHNEYVLDDSQGLLLRAMKDAPHPTEDDVTLAAGEEFLLKGPCRYIPHKDIRVKSFRQAISLPANEGVYIQNDDTGEVRLVRGPADVFIEHNESLWYKVLSNEELEALGFQSVNDDADMRLLTPSMRPRTEDYQAVVLELEDRECVYLYEGSNVRVVFGPQTVFLEPHERPKVMHISGGVPLKPNKLRIARLSLGPDFIRDVVRVLTRDNATLRLDVTYRWRFDLVEGEEEKLFALKDFIGFVARTLSAEIRAEAARHNFESFHGEASLLIANAIFGGEGISERRFDENNMVIFGVDVESVTPEDDKIKEQLSTAILTNVEIYTQAVREQADLARERDLIDGQTENAKRRQGLIDQETENERRQKIAQAQAEAEAILIRAEAEAQATRIRAAAELEAEQARLSAIMVLLESEGGAAYIRLEQARVLQPTDKVVVPTDSRIYLGTDRIED
ncbi:MAG: hypothetical protein ACLFTK_15875 [Anaerolineales bacterium]